MKKTKVICGACFGYFNAIEFEECRSCKLSEACEKASVSKRSEEIKRQEKKSYDVIEDLKKEFS